MSLHLIVWALILVISAVGLTGCSSATAEENSSTENMSMDIHLKVSPTGSMSETDPLPHSPYVLDDVHCYDMVSGAKRIEHWVDKLIPGKSSIDDLKMLVDLSTTNPVYSGFWEYRDNDVQLQFWGSVLRAKSDPRNQLGDIVLEYGLPEQIVWHIPRKAYHLAKYDTILLYPERHALFHTEEQVIYFGWETAFEYSSIVIPERYMELTAQYTDTENDDYLFFMWPCSYP